MQGLDSLNPILIIDEKVKLVSVSFSRIRLVWVMNFILALALSPLMC